MHRLLGIFSLALFFSCFLVRGETFVTDNGNGPSIGLAANGSAVVGYTRFDSETESYNVHIQRFDEFGHAASSELTINLVSARLGSFGAEPTIDVDADAEGNFVVAWYKDEGDAARVMARFYDHDGTPTTNPLDVSEPFSADSLAPLSVSMNAKGNSIICWFFNDRSEASSTREIQAQRFDQNGTKQGGVFQPIAAGAYETEPYRASIDLNSAGHFVLAALGSKIETNINLILDDPDAAFLTEQSEICVQRHSANNELLQSETIFSGEAQFWTANGITTNFGITSLEIAYSDQEEYALVWLKESNKDMENDIDQYSISSVTGSANRSASEPVLVDIDSRILRAPDLAINAEGTTRVVWSEMSQTDNFAVYSRDFSLGGTSLGLPRIISVGHRSIHNTRIAATNDSFAVAWEARNDEQHATGAISLKNTPYPAPEMPEIHIERLSAREVRLFWDTKLGTEYHLLSASVLPHFGLMETMIGSGGEVSRTISIEEPAQFWALQEQ